jgi:hypothetical protein
VARQNLPAWCAAHGGGLTRDELRLYLEEVASVMTQAGVRQGLVRRSDSAPAERTKSRGHLRIIK